MKERLIVGDGCCATTVGRAGAGDVRRGAAGAVEQRRHDAARRAARQAQRVRQRRQKEDARLRRHRNVLPSTFT